MHLQQEKNLGNCFLDVSGASTMQIRDQRPGVAWLYCLMLGIFSFSDHIRHELICEMSRCLFLDAKASRRRRLVRETQSTTQECGGLLLAFL